MTHFEDLSSCTYGFASDTEKLKAVGWLAWGHPYTERQTDLSEAHFHQLLRLLVNPWEPGHFMGAHECEFCFGPEDEGHRFTLERCGLIIHFGASNLFVPGKDCIYVAPSMIAHYVHAHDYEPPAEFWEAVLVLSCPEMGSETYRRALIVNGPSDPEWTRDVTMETEIAQYVFTYYRHLMTRQERLAHRHLVTTAKAMGGRTDAGSQTEARKTNKNPFLLEWFSSDPEVLRLASEGLDVFVERVAQRILDEHRDEVRFNNCPKCGGLTRTPKARQCRFCGFDWHGIR
jgi:hypothetical protein